ncbi:MAG TPA: hypothetical protein VHC96_14825 [Puia sp.]|nr:hypothetical protein [Puia sp.]
MTRKPLSLLVVLLSTLLSCSGQDKNKFDEKSQHPSIQVITDPQEVATLRTSMEENIRERNKAFNHMDKTVARP